MNISVTLSDEDYMKIKAFCDKEDMKISSILRKGAKRLIDEIEQKKEG